MVEEKQLDPAKIPASGRDGRITKGDVVDFLDQPAAKAAGGDKPRPPRLASRPRRPRRRSAPRAARISACP